jgi:hypothetical protein
MHVLIYNPADMKMQNNFGKIQLIFSACAAKRVHIQHFLVKQSKSTIKIEK